MVVHDVKTCVVYPVNKYPNIRASEHPMWVTTGAHWKPEKQCKTRQCHTDITDTILYKYIYIFLFKAMMI